jgi:hypothetical protein
LSEIVEQAKARRQRLGKHIFSAGVGFFLAMGMLVLLAAPFFVFIPKRLAVAVPRHRNGHVSSNCFSYADRIADVATEAVCKRIAPSSTRRIKVGE